MKKLALFLILVLISIVGFGQRNSLDIGVETGPSLIFLRGNTFLKNYHKPTAGFSGGFSLQYNFTKIISIRTGVAYERKGSLASIPRIDVNGNYLGYNSKVRSNFEYLTLPILVQATFGKKINFFVNAGAYMGVLLKQTSVFINSNIPIRKLKTNNTKFDKLFDTGLTIGLGLAIPIKQRFIISFEARNNLGLYNVSKVPVINNGTIKTNSTNFLFGFMYRFSARTGKK